MDTKDKSLPKFPPKHSLGAALVGLAPLGFFGSRALKALLGEKDNPHKAAYKKRLKEEKEAHDKMREIAVMACYRQSNMHVFMDETFECSDDFIDQGYETRYD